MIIYDNNIKQQQKDPTFWLQLVGCPYQQIAIPPASTKESWKCSRPGEKKKEKVKVIFLQNNKYCKLRLVHENVIISVYLMCRHVIDLTLISFKK